VAQNKTSMLIDLARSGEASGDQGCTPVTRAWISETFTRVVAVAVRSGSAPDKPLDVDHVTFQCVVTDTGNLPSGCDDDGAEYV
jgi:hypothetical protein